METHQFWAFFVIALIAGGAITLAVSNATMTGYAVQAQVEQESFFAKFFGRQAVIDTEPSPKPYPNPDLGPLSTRCSGCVITPKEIPDLSYCTIGCLRGPAEEFEGCVYGCSFEYLGVVTAGPCDCEGLYGSSAYFTCLGNCGRITHISLDSAILGTGINCDCEGLYGSSAYFTCLGNCGKVVNIPMDSAKIEA